MLLHGGSKGHMGTPDNMGMENLLVGDMTMHPRSPDLMPLSCGIVGIRR